VILHSERPSFSDIFLWLIPARSSFTSSQRDDIRYLVLGENAFRTPDQRFVIDAGMHRAISRIFSIDPFLFLFIESFLQKETIFKRVLSILLPFFSLLANFTAAISLSSWAPEGPAPSSRDRIAPNLDKPAVPERFPGIRYSVTKSGTCLWPICPPRICLPRAGTHDEYGKRKRTITRLRASELNGEYSVAG
jgi:hypothetical protein